MFLGLNLCVFASIAFSTSTQLMAAPALFIIDTVLRGIEYFNLGIPASTLGLVNDILES
jgi:hypothetical protein